MQRKVDDERTIALVVLFFNKSSIEVLSPEMTGLVR